MIVDLEAGFDAADDASALSSSARRDASITALAFCAARNCGGVAAVEEGVAACLEDAATECESRDTRPPIELAESLLYPPASGAALECARARFTSTHAFGWHCVASHARTKNNTKFGLNST